ncbi:MAG: type I phosphomannose isomerase catalytic subunit [Verrucomicrobiales bacterium]
MKLITFQPLYQTRVWGGRELANTFSRELPDEQPYGESWELSDRPDEQSLVSAGPFKGLSLNELWREQRAEIFGPAYLPDERERFPLLIKILDARDDLSIQVHPPAELAPRLGGEPKTEMWFVAQADPGAKLYVGLRKGVTEADFKAALAAGEVAGLVHAIEPRPGESIFIPSGRLHAIGGGFLIFEIQENSDTTYRVFDWNRLGLDGRARELHIEQSLASIDFQDFEPGMDEPQDSLLASCPLFEVARAEAAGGSEITAPDPERFCIINLISGRLRSASGSELKAGDCALWPAQGESLTALTASEFLLTTLPLRD